MMRIEPEISGTGIVVLGNFNPAIFTPAWFALQDILPRSVADNAEVQIIHPNVSIFSTEWLQFQVTPNDFRATTESAPVIRVRDFTESVFGECLPHTPIKAIGINRYVHFRTAGPAVRDQVGRMLAPLEPWGEIANELELDTYKGGMVSLTMRQYQPEGRPSGGQINVKVEPSIQIDDGRSGIYVDINDHYKINENSADLLRFLKCDNFELSLKRADKIINHVMSLVKEV